MGPKIHQSQYPSDKDLEPGAYQILNAHKRTAIQVSEHDPTQVVAWKRHDKENQQWCLQRSGDGYQLQNKHYVDAYLAAFSTDNKGLVYASKYPTTWMFLLYDGDYIIQLADRNRVLDLYHGSGHNGTMIRIHKEDGTHMPRRIWRLERLRSSDKCENKELSKLRTLLHQRDDTIRQLRQELKSKEEAPSHAYKAIEELALLRNQYKLLESRLSQQQAEVTSCQAKADACFLSFPFGSPTAYGHSIVVVMAFVFLSLPLYRPLRRGLGGIWRLIWRGIHGLYILAAY